MTDLIELIEKSNETPSVRSNVNQALLTSELFCLGELVDNDGEQMVNITELEDPQGNIFIPCFTSMETMQGWASEGESYLTCKGEDLFPMVHDATLIFNPESEHEYVLSSAEIHKLIGS